MCVSYLAVVVLLSLIIYHPFPSLPDRSHFLYRTPLLRAWASSLYSGWIVILLPLFHPLPTLSHIVTLDSLSLSLFYNSYRNSPFLPANKFNKECVFVHSIHSLLSLSSIYNKSSTWPHNMMMRRRRHGHPIPPTHSTRTNTERKRPTEDGTNSRQTFACVFVVVVVCNHYV